MPDRHILRQMCGAIVKTGTFLDLDMTSLGQHFGEFWRWWVSEISAMVPRPLRQARKRVSGTIAFWHDDATLWVDGEAYEAGRERSAVIIIPENQILVRSTMMPALSIADLRKIVMLDLDRLMPFPPDSAYADVIFSNEQSESGRREVQIAAIPKDLARSIDQAARSNGLIPTAIGMISDDVMTFDFLPAMQIDGSVPAPDNSRKFWWSLVAILFALNLGLLVYIDEQKVNRLNDLVESQSLSAIGARKVAGRISKEDQLRGEILLQRERNDAVAQLALTTRQMPEGVWVQRYSANGDVLRIAGYKQDGTDLLGKLRKSGSFSAIRTSISDGAAESGTGQPFDITAEIRGK